MLSTCAIGVWEERFKKGLAMFDNPVDLIEKIRLGEDTFLELKEVRFAGSKVTAPHRDSLARLFQQRSQARIIRFDEQPVPGATLDDLKPQLWLSRCSPPATLSAKTCALPPASKRGGTICHSLI